MNFLKTILKMVIIIGGSLLIVSCSGRYYFNKAELYTKESNPDQAVEYYLKALHSDPSNPRYRLALSNALISASDLHYKQGKELFEAGDLKLALIKVQKALDYFPENDQAKLLKKSILKIIEEEKAKSREKTEIEKVKENAAPLKEETAELNVSSQTPISFKIKEIDLKELLNSLQKLSGINILYDEAFQTKKVSVNLNDPFEKLLNKLLMQTKNFYKVIDPQTIIVIPDTPQKRKQYEDLVMQTFFISNADINQLQQILRTQTEIKIVTIDPTLNAITVRDTPGKVKLAKKLIDIYDKAKGELLVDVEIMEINKNRAQEYGIELSKYSITESLGVESNTSQAGIVRGHMFKYLDSSDFVFSLPSVIYKLLQTDSESKVIARPQLRVLDQESVQVKVGDRVPFPMTSFVPYSTGGLNQQPITSYQLNDVGISIELTPRIHHDGWITFKLKFELTFITSPGTATLPPTIGTRSVTTLIRLKDNETGLLAGLLRDTERKSLRGLPVINKIPILKDIFAGNTNEITQTDIILTLTPRIIRYPEIREENLEPVWVGTEDDLGLKKEPPELFQKEKLDEEKSLKEKK